MPGSGVLAVPCDLSMHSFSASRPWLAAALVCIAAGSAITLLHSHGGGHGGLSVLSAMLRVLGILLLCAAAIRARSLSMWMFLAMFVGIELGVDAPHFSVQLKFLSDIFLRLVKLIVAPLILGTLVTGIAGHSNLGQIRRIGIKAIVYFEVVTTLALLTGLVAINLTRAGEGVHVRIAAEAGAGALPGANLQAEDSQHWQHFLLSIVPENIAKSIAENQILQVVFFAVLIGISLATLSEAKRRPLLAFAESLTATMFAVTNLVMYYAPIGIAAAIAYTVGQMGVGVLLPLGKLLATFYLAVIAFMSLVLLPIALLVGVRVRDFVRAVAEPAAIGFATSTSEAALPRAMEAMEAFGVPRHIVAFVIPVGYSFNLDGSSLYLALGSIFAAQAAGIHLGWRAQLAMVFTLMLASKGVAGVPRAVLVVLLSTAATFRLPLEPFLLMLGVDSFMDMGRTSVNVIGNCLASAVIARTERDPVVGLTSSGTIAPNHEP